MSLKLRWQENILVKIRYGTVWQEKDFQGKEAGPYEDYKTEGENVISRKDFVPVQDRTRHLLSSFKLSIQTATSSSWLIDQSNHRR